MPIAARAKTARTKIIAFAAAGIAAAALTACDAQPGPSLTPDANTRQVTVVGAGQVQGTPDTLTVNASMEFLAPDVTGAMNQTNERQQAVINALVAAGIDAQGHRHHPGRPAAAVRHRRHHDRRVPGDQLHQREDPRRRQGLGRDRD